MLLVFGFETYIFLEIKKQIISVIPNIFLPFRYCAVD